MNKVILKQCPRSYLSRDVSQVFKKKLFVIKNLDLILCILEFILSDRSISLFGGIFFHLMIVRSVKQVVSGVKRENHLIWTYSSVINRDLPACLNSLFNSRFQCACLFRCSIAGLFKGRLSWKPAASLLWWPCLSHREVGGSRFLLKHGGLIPCCDGWNSVGICQYKTRSWQQKDMHFFPQNVDAGLGEKATELFNSSSTCKDQLWPRNLVSLCWEVCLMFERCCHNDDYCSSSR